MRKVKNRNNKGQEEMIGFILIIIIVIVAGLVFFSFSLRKEPLNQDSLEIENFLQGVMQYTTSCAINFEPQYSSIRDLTKNCYNRQVCPNLDNTKACDLLEEELTGLLDTSLNPSEEAFTKAYCLSIYFNSNTTREDILNISNGDCDGNRKGGEYIIPEFPGSIIASLEVYTN